jgi:hypothetical protein
VRKTDNLAAICQPFRLSQPSRSPRPITGIAFRLCAALLVVHSCSLYFKIHYIFWPNLTFSDVQVFVIL